ncbi:MAG: hypothetical protein F6K47_08395 [Symploca sp. SIO2E6]|nr:hypothetical protein [Symploca sp. SIO2E6]
MLGGIPDENFHHQVMKIDSSEVPRSLLRLSDQATNNQQQTTNNKQPTTNNKQPTTNNQQPITNNQ